MSLMADPEHVHQVNDLLKNHWEGFEDNIELKTDIFKTEQREELLSKLLTTHVYPSLAPSKTKRLWSRISVVAAAVAAIAVGIYFFNANTAKPKDYSHLMTNDIAPGKIGATLTLANGKQIRLSDVGSGEIAQESGISITKTADGQIVYEIKENKAEAGKLNTLSTARGETYLLTLPDQSKVWLNAASSLTFNSGLVSDGFRSVKLTGEAYFEVAKDSLHPFIVESGNQRIEVLGTHFNVNAYDDEKVFRTTLLEGSVKVTENDQSKFLKPGQQAANANGNVKLSKVDTELAVAWKSNNFTFDRLDIREIMRSLARWYNVEVIFEGEIPKGEFWGSVSRFDHISKVLIPLEATGDVRFRVEGRKIYVSR